MFIGIVDKEVLSVILNLADVEFLELVILFRPMVLFKTLFCYKTSVGLLLHIMSKLSVIFGQRNFENILV